MSPVQDIDRLYRELRNQVGSASEEAGRLKAIDICVRAGYEVLGAGMSRVAIASGPGLVAKLGWNWPAGMVANAVEYEIWRSADATRPYLCPVENISESGVVYMTRTEPLVERGGIEAIKADLAPDRAEAECRGKLAVGRSALVAYGIEPDLHIRNWGRLHGRPVAVDYGRLAGAAS